MMKDSEFEDNYLQPSTLKSWLQRGDVEKLEHVVLEGRGARLLGERSHDLRTRVFLRGLPNYLTKISLIHGAVKRGSLLTVQKLISEDPKKKLSSGKDSTGTPLLHKAVYYDHLDIVEWLVQNYPTTVSQRDKEGRTALHYCANCQDPDTVWDVLINTGCDASIWDKKGHPASYYLQHSSEIDIPEICKMSNRKTNSGKDSWDFKPSNIRIWIHNRDIGKLQQVLWEGYGAKLRCEISNNSRVKKFLEAAPYIMGTIKDIHTATVNNDLEGLKNKIEDPVCPVILISKDTNGQNVLHKAAGLGFYDIAKEILERYPPTVDASNNEGRTPLHYAAAQKDDGAMYDLLMENGADGSKLDNKQKAAAFYKNRPFDIDPANLTLIPDAPRVSGSTYPKNWDWRILESDESASKGIRKVVSGIEADSAFGSAESTSKSEQVENEGDDIEAGEIEAGDIEKEDDVAQIQDDPEDIEKEVNEATEDNDPGNNEEKSSDDDVVTGTIPDDAEGTEEGEGEQQEEPVNEQGDQVDDENPNTGDSGVDDPGNDNDQAVVGEHNELSDAEVNDDIIEGDPEVDDLLENGNMEQLAALVLNGEGRRLVGRQSSNSELQAFIDNVPAYMGKIHAVHMAAREGNLRDLQSALDRRKFAIAKDGTSPHGATPLHVAVIFGNTAVIRYLAGRFPETTHAVDIDGRTPLHYAATLADNGHYYNLLLHLGANPLIQDNFGQKADYYKENRHDLSHKKLLRDFGASEKLADEMLTDKDDNQTDIPIFRPEEGQYLASSLGDPLIKGLTEVANARPKDPVTYLATYLYNFASKNKPNGGMKQTGSDVLIIPERENGNVFDDENSIPDEDAGYPQSPNSDIPETNFNEANRDEHGQSMLHFAAVREYSAGGFYHLLKESQINVAFRDELYRTARDVAEQAKLRENIQEIDLWVVYLAARGETEKLVELLLEGYDHILDAEDEGKNIIEVAEERGHEATVQFLQSIPNYETQREEVHNAIRMDDFELVKELLNKNNGGGKLLAVGKNKFGRCALHIAVLRENESIIQYIVTNYPETLRIGDNLERKALHYAMGEPSVEELSNILIKAGARRTMKDLRSRQPSYYFMNKSDIEKLQEEERNLMKPV